MSAKNIVVAAFAIFAALFVCGCKSVFPARSGFSHFTGFENFSRFTSSTNENGEQVMVSPVIPGHIVWNQAIISWNADAPAGTYVKVEACAISGGWQTKFYTMGEWSLDGKIFPRTSV